MLARIEKVMKKHEEEMDRIEQAYKKDEAMVMAELSQWMQILNNAKVNDDYKKVAQAKVNELTQTIVDMEKQRRLNPVNTHSINECAKIINRMMGFDITKVEIAQEDTERDEMEKLSAEELRELIKVSKGEK